jgi:hypothetical protein
LDNFPHSNQSFQNHRHTILRHHTILRRHTSLRAAGDGGWGLP